MSGLQTLLIHIMTLFTSNEFLKIDFSTLSIGLCFVIKLHYINCLQLWAMKFRNLPRIIWISWFTGRRWVNSIQDSRTRTSINSLFLNGKITFFILLFPEQKFCYFFNFLLFLLDLLFWSLPRLVILLPIDGRTRENPISTWSQDSIHFYQIHTICKQMKLHKSIWESNQ